MKEFEEWLNGLNNDHEETLLEKWEKEYQDVIYTPIERAAYVYGSNVDKDSKEEE